MCAFGHAVELVVAEEEGESGEYGEFGVGVEDAG